MQDEADDYKQDRYLTTSVTTTLPERLTRTPSSNHRASAAPRVASHVSLEWDLEHTVRLPLSPRLCPEAC
jgi:hypothetical protein